MMKMSLAASAAANAALVVNAGPVSVCVCVCVYVCVRRSIVLMLFNRKLIVVFFFGCCSFLIAQSGEDFSRLVTINAGSYEFLFPIPIYVTNSHLVLTHVYVCLC